MPHRVPATPMFDGMDDRLFVSRKQCVIPDWIDYNGHLNMAYYHVLFDRCVDEAFETFGLDLDYVSKKNASFFTLEAHTTYLGEIGDGDETVCSFQILDHDTKRVHYFQELYRLADGLLSATSEQIVMHIDLETHRSAPFDTVVRKRIAEMAARHADVPKKPQVGHVIGIRRY